MTLVTIATNVESYIQTYIHRELEYTIHESKGRALLCFFVYVAAWSLKDKDGCETLVLLRQLGIIIISVRMV